MTRAEVKSMIDEVGIPAAYHHFDESTGQQPPFICFLYPGDNDMKADNINYVGINQLAIELYTDEPDFDLEDAVKAVLTDHGLAFARNQEYIDSEKMWMTVFNTEVIIDG